MTEEKSKSYKVGAAFGNLGIIIILLQLFSISVLALAWVIKKLFTNIF